AGSRRARSDDVVGHRRAPGSAQEAWPDLQSLPRHVSREGRLTCGGIGTRRRHGSNLHAKADGPWASAHCSRQPPQVWDVPTRLVHWALVTVVALSWWTGKNNVLDMHRWSGYGVFGLLVFRLLWGLIGSSTAKFSGFVKHPALVLTYVRRDLLARAHV